MSKERPIIFSAPMVRAILEGRKSMTRRIVKFNDSGRVKLNGKQWHIEDPDAINGCPYGTVGDRLWVKETFMGTKDCLSYRATDPRQVIEFGFDRWTPSIHMPRWASRITLEITAIRVERLQEITNQDAQKEGPPWANPHRHGPEGLEFDEHPGKIIRDPYADRHNTGINDCWICAFRMIWSDIHGPGSWDRNDWCWVIEFRRIA